MSTTSSSSAAPLPWKRLLVAVCGLALCLSPGVSAQRAGVHDGLFLGMSNIGSTQGSAIAVVDAANTVAAIQTQPNGAWPAGGNVWGATMDPDNERVLIHGFTSSGTRYHLFAFDPRARAVVATLWSGPAGFGVPQNLTNLAVDQDGDVVSYDSVLGQFVVFDPTARTWSSVRVPAPVNAGLGGLVADRLFGGLRFASSLSRGTQALLVADPAFRTTTLAMNTVVQAAYGGDLLQNGDWISSSDDAARYYTVQGTTWVGAAASATRYWDVTAEKFAAPGRGFYAVEIPGQQRVVHVDAATGATTSIVASPTAFPTGAWLLEVLPLYRRDLGSVRAGAAAWELRVNPGAGRYAGASYVVAGGFTGATPATTLADGREIFLRFDPLAVLTASGPLAPFVTGNHGRLDAAGKASVRLDLSAFGRSLNGLRLTFCGVVLDASAPSGVAWVLDPWTITVDVP